jgi:DNA-binding NtrC family response regulator
VACKSIRCGGPRQWWVLYESRDLEVILTQAGYVVIPAVDGQEALELSRTYTNTIDLVVSDIIMPRMTGPDLLEHIRSERPDTQVLLMSGYASPAYIDYATKHDFIRKPFAPKQFMDEVKNVVEPPAARLTPIQSGSSRIDVRMLKRVSRQ